jgi:hypothetical protein
MRKLFVAIVLIAATSALAGAAHAQALAPKPAGPAATPGPGVAVAPGAPAAAPTCANQYADAEGVTPAQLITGGFDIKAGWPGGMWLQKGKETYFCNTGRPTDGTVICWTLREPVRGGSCN